MYAFAREPRFCYTDLERLDPEQRWELIDGVAYAMSGPSLAHQLLLGELYAALKQHFRAGPCRVVLAPFDVKLSDYDVVQPDLLISCQGQLEQRFHRGAPDLVVEILSPSSLRHDRIRKLNLYARAGVPEYWMVTPNPLIVEVFSNEEGRFLSRGSYGEEHTLRSHQFADFQLNLGPLAATLPPDPYPDRVQENPPVYASSLVN